MAKVDKIEHERRIKVVQGWILDDLPFSDIVSKCCNEWLLSLAQAKRYIKIARERWSLDRDEEIEKKRAIKVEGLKKLKQSLGKRYTTQPFGVSVILKIDQEISKLEGLYPATRLEHSAPGGKPLFPEPDLTKVPREALTALVASFKDIVSAAKP